MKNHEKMMITMIKFVIFLFNSNDDDVNVIQYLLTDLLMGCVIVNHAGPR